MAKAATVLTISTATDPATAMCHSLDVNGIPLCGADLLGVRPAHAIGICWMDDHPRCQVCEDLWDVEDLTHPPGHEDCLEAA